MKNVSFVLVNNAKAKTFDKKTSILHYLVKLVKSNEESLLAFKDDIAPVFDAQRILLDTTCEELKKLSKDYEYTRGIIDNYIENKEKNVRIHRTQNVNIYNSPCGVTKIEKFIENANTSMEDALSASKDIKEKYRALLLYFGEDETMTSDEFFGTIQSFVTAFDTAHNQIIAQEKQAVSLKTPLSSFFPSLLLFHKDNIYFLNDFCRIQLALTLSCRKESKD